MYIQIQRENVWQVYTEQIAKGGLLRGGGNTSSAKMFKSSNGEESVRPVDFKIVFDQASGEYNVYPDPTKGLSFSSNLQRLRDIPIPGRVWLLPRGSELPEGLCFNYKSIDHPLLSVAEDEDERTHHQAQRSRCNDERHRSEDMSHAIAFPDSLKVELQKLAASCNYVLATEILLRGGPDELVLESNAEAQVVANVARVEMMKTILQCPFWDEDDPRHDPAHEERFHDVVNGLFEKTVSYIGQDLRSSPRSDVLVGQRSDSRSGFVVHARTASMTA